MNKKNKLKKKLAKYGIFSLLVLSLVIVIFLFTNIYADTQPDLKIKVGNNEYNAINQPLVVDTMFDKVENEYESPMQVVEKRKYNAIQVTPGSKLVLITEALSGIRTTLVPPGKENTTCYIWKNGIDNEVQATNASTYANHNNYKVILEAPEQPGEYIVSLNLDYNKSKMRYSFKIDVK